MLGSFKVILQWFLDWKSWKKSSICKRVLAIIYLDLLIFKFIFIILGRWQFVPQLIGPSPHLWLNLKVSFKYTVLYDLKHITVFFLVFNHLDSLLPNKLFDEQQSYVLTYKICHASSCPLGISEIHLNQS